MLNIGWFSTGRGEGSRGLLRFVQERLARQPGEAGISFVFSNREWGEAEGSDQFFRLVESYGLPLRTRSSAAFRRAAGGGPWAALRPEFDRAVMDAIADYRPDVCVLAGYMLIVGGEMSRRYPLLNLHPALPDGPIGTWQEVIWTLLERRATRTGAMLHRATEQVDRGPVISYCTVPIDGPEFAPHWPEIAGRDLAALRAEMGENLPLFQQIRQAEYHREPYLLYETLRALAQGRVDLGADHSATGTGPALCLDGEIDAAMAADGVL